MEKEEFHAEMIHFYLKKWTAAQIKAELNKVYRGTAVTLKIIYFWINEFKRGRTSAKDEVRPGRPVEAIAPEVIKTILSLFTYSVCDEEVKIHRIVVEDHRGILCNTSKPFARKIANGTSEIGAPKNPPKQTQTTAVSMAKVHELGFKLLPHHPILLIWLLLTSFYWLIKYAVGSFLCMNFDI